MSSQNKTVIRRVFEELFNQHKLALIPELYCADCVGVDAANPSELKGHEALEQLIKGYRTVFPEHYYQIEEMIAEGDFVCVRWTVLPNTPKLDADLRIPGMSLCEFRDGKIARIWQHWDNLGFLQAAGVVSKETNAGTAIASLMNDK